MTATGKSEITDREIIITREFDAPRELLWQVWTEPKHIEKWWGPRKFTTKVSEIDLKPGGTWRYTMIGPDGKEYPIKGIFSEVVRPERIITSDGFDEDFDAGDLDLPQGIVLTVLFDDLGERTRLTLRIAHPTIEDRKKHEDMGVVGGWNSSFDKKDEYLAELQEESRDK